MTKTRVTMHSSAQVDFFYGGFDAGCRSLSMIDGSELTRPAWSPSSVRAGVSSATVPVSTAPDADDDDEDLILEDLDFDFDDFATNSSGDDPVGYLASGVTVPRCYGTSFSDVMLREPSCSDAVYFRQYSLDEEAGMDVSQFVDMPSRADVRRSDSPVVDEQENTDGNWFQALHRRTEDSHAEFVQCEPYLQTEKLFDGRAPASNSKFLPVSGLNKQSSCPARPAHCVRHLRPPLSKRKHQRQAANQRERRRMKTINDAFICLRDRIPAAPTGRSSYHSSSTDRKLSKVDTLRLAVRYIRHLTDVLNSSPCDDRAVVEPTDFRPAVEEENKIILYCRFWPGCNEDVSYGLVGHSLTWQYCSHVVGTPHHHGQRNKVCSKVWWVPRDDDTVQDCSNLY